MKNCAILLVVITNIAVADPNVSIKGAFGYKFGEKVEESDESIEWCLNSFCSGFNRDFSPHPYTVGLQLNREGSIYQISTASTENSNPVCFERASKLADQVGKKFQIKFEEEEEITDHFYYRSWKFSDFDATPVSIEITCFDYTVAKNELIPMPNNFSFNIIYKDNRYDPSSNAYKSYMEYKNASDTK